MPPALWLIPESEPSPELHELAKKGRPKVSFTLNGLEWFEAGEFVYEDPEPPKEEEEEDPKKKKDAKKDAKKKGK